MFKDLIDTWKNVRNVLELPAKWRRIVVYSEGAATTEHLRPIILELINEYDAKYPVIHIDCYREDELERWIKLGINDYMDEKNILIIEWADKIKSLLPVNTIHIQFSHKSITSREITLSTNEYSRN